MASKLTGLMLCLLVSKQEVTGSYCSRTLKEGEKYVHRLKMVSVNYWRINRLFSKIGLLSLCCLLTTFHCCSSLFQNKYIYYNTVLPH